MVTQKYDKGKVSLCLYGGSKPPPYLRAKVPSTAKTKDLCPSAFSFAHAGAKEKAIKKKTPMGIDTYAKHVCRRRRDGEISRFAKRDEDSASSTSAPFKKKVHENYNAKREERESVKSRFRSCP